MIGSFDYSKFYINNMIGTVTNLESIDCSIRIISHLFYVVSRPLQGHCYDLLKSLKESKEESEIINIIQVYLP